MAPLKRTTHRRQGAWRWTEAPAEGPRAGGAAGVRELRPRLRTDCTRRRPERPFLSAFGCCGHLVPHPTPPLLSLLPPVPPGSLVSRAPETLSVLSVWVLQVGVASCLPLVFGTLRAQSERRRVEDIPEMQSSSRVCVCTWWEEGNVRPCVCGDGYVCLPAAD